jgi:hypothetical protein
MKYACLLILFFTCFSGKLIAQQDSLIKADSIYFYTPHPDGESFDSVPLHIDTPIIRSTFILSHHDIIWPSFSNAILKPVIFNTAVFKSYFTPEGARKDIRKGEPRILFPGGFGSPDLDSKADKAFEQKYGVTFYSQGCIRMEDDDETGYNEVVFAYLDKKFGEEWRNELRHDAIGFEAPKTSHSGTAVKLASPLSMQLAKTEQPAPDISTPDGETSVWWYVLPTSGFALLLSLYFIKRRKD